MGTHKDLPVITFSDAAAWQAWLKEHHQASGSIWVKFAKKGSGLQSVTYEEARDGALIYGWIDGLKNKYDNSFYLVRFSPRKPTSTWSKINCEIAEALIEAGQMQAAGLAQVEAAKKDGRWGRAYDSPSTMNVPDDLELQFVQFPTAKRGFEQLDRANRYAFLYRIQTAKTPVARARCIQKTIEMLGEGKVYHPQS